MLQELWYTNAVLYSLDVQTFLDSNGNGVGDFEGLTENRRVQAPGFIRGDKPVGNSQPRALVSS